MRTTTHAITCDICGKAYKEVREVPAVVELGISTMPDVNYTAGRVFDYCGECLAVIRIAVAGALEQRSGKPAEELDCWAAVSV